DSECEALRKESKMSEQNLIFETNHKSKNLTSDEYAKSGCYKTEEFDSNRGGSASDSKALESSTEASSNINNTPKINFSVSKPPQPVKLGEDEVDERHELQSENSTASNNVKLETTTSTSQSSNVTSQQSLNSHVPSSQQEQKSLPTTEIEGDKKKRKR
ncbi:8923_t:CDS:1, partial [Ambispora leptoticha]